jgi:hypothetical protein
MMARYATSVNGRTDNHLAATLSICTADTEDAARDQAKEEFTAVYPDYTPLLVQAILIE